MNSAQQKYLAADTKRDQAWAAAADPQTGFMAHLVDLVNRGAIENEHDCMIAMQCVRVVYGDLLHTELGRYFEEREDSEDPKGGGEESTT